MLAFLVTCGASVVGASPFPQPITPHQLACDLSPTHDPDDYLAWWTAVPRNAVFRAWFWRNVVPRTPGIDACGDAVADTLWLQAVPDGWMPVPASPGWPSATGGYYEQTFWLRAVPRNWLHSQHPQATGLNGYYARLLWLRAVPEGWAPRDALTLGHGVYGRPRQSYYRWMLWEHAVPEDWLVPRGAVPVMPPRGYYAETLWLHAVPEGWAPAAALAIDGQENVGFYAYWLRHFAVPYDFAWCDDLSIDGSTGAGYYDYWNWAYFARAVPYYAQQEREAVHHVALANAQGPLPIDRWFRSDARAVVVLTFDTEGLPQQVCAVTDTLRAAGVPATFLMLGRSVSYFATDPHGAAALACLAGFDLGNHTLTHPLSAELLPQSRLDALPDAAQQSEMAGGDTVLRTVFPDAHADSFRTPGCDVRSSFDTSVARNLGSLLRTDGSAIFVADSSVATVAAAVAAEGVAPPPGLARVMLRQLPYPFVVGRSADGQPLVELPFAFPSDFVAGRFFGLDSADAPPDRHTAGFTANVWKDTLDEVVASHGLMVVLMHPWIESRYFGGSIYDPTGHPDGLADFIAYAQATPGVFFSTLHESAALVRAYVAR